MKRTTEANREMAVFMKDDDSIKDQPAEKSLKTEEEPVSSSELIDLRQKVAKLEAQLEVERSRAADERRRDGVTIDELRRRLAQYEDGQPEPPPPVENETLQQLIQAIYPNGLPPLPMDDIMQQQAVGDQEIGGDAMSTETAIEIEDVKDGEAIGQSKKVSKKRKSSNKGDSESESAEKKHRGTKTNSTDLECPDCEYRTRNVKCWDGHLRTSHSTTPKLAGLALLCDCGNLSFSKKHSENCDVANFIIIHHTIDVPTTPQCVLCETFPKSIRGYTQHLLASHNSTLDKNNIYLKCSCGDDFFSDSRRALRKHVKKCNSHDFTLHELDEK